MRTFVQHHVTRLHRHLHAGQTPKVSRRFSSEALCQQASAWRPPLTEVGAISVADSVHSHSSLSATRSAAGSAPVCTTDYHRQRTNRPYRSQATHLGELAVVANDIQGPGLVQILVHVDDSGDDVRVRPVRVVLLGSIRKELQHM